MSCNDKMKAIRLSEYEGPLSQDDIKRYIRVASKFYGVEIPEHSVHEKYKVKDNFIVLGYYEHSGDDLHFNIKPDKRLVFHEFGHYLYHKIYPGKCEGGSPECEIFARKVEDFAVSPKGPLGIPWGPVRRAYRSLKYGF